MLTRRVLSVTAHSETAQYCMDTRGKTMRIRETPEKQDVKTFDPKALAMHENHSTIGFGWVGVHKFFLVTLRP